MWFKKKKTEISFTKKNSIVLCETIWMDVVFHLYLQLIFIFIEEITLNVPIIYLGKLFFSSALCPLSLCPLSATLFIKKRILWGPLKTIKPGNEAVVSQMLL